MNTTTKDKSFNARFGIIGWHDGEDPFAQHLEVLKGLTPTEGEAALGEYVETASLVHADMTTARAIAISLFGAEWKDFVMDVYDRLQTEREEEEDA